jgi:tetraacyldisaccharide 4'-kinase
MSDEEREHRDELPGVPVVARPDRAAGVRALLAGPNGAGVGCVVLDDGFQHRRLARDLDIVLVDASRPPDRDALLPRGYLREPIGSLGRAGAVVITHAELVTPREVERVRALVGCELGDAAPVAVAEHVWTGLQRVDGGDPGGHRLEEWEAWLRGRRVLAVCAIGQPAGFLAAVDRSGAERVATMVLADHDPFDMPTLKRLSGLVQTHDPDVVLMTAKDHAKLGGRGGWVSACQRPVVVPTLGLRWRSGEDALRAKVHMIFGDAPR